MLRHDCSSHGTARSSQNVAQAVLFLRSQRAPRRQGANFRAGSTGAPLPVLARPQPALCSSQQIVQGVHGWPHILLSQNCRPHSRRSQHFGQEVKADPILLSQNRRPHSRRSQHFGQEVKAEVNCGSHSRSSLVARCRSLSRRDYLHEDRLHACKVQGA